MNKKYLSFFTYLKPQTLLISIIVFISIIQTGLMAIGYLTIPEVIFAFDPEADVSTFANGDTSTLDFVGKFKLWMLQNVSELPFLDRVIQMAIILGCIFILKNLLDYLRRILTAWFEISVVTKIQESVFKHIISLPLKTVSEKDTGHLLSLLTGDTMQVFTSMKRVFEHMITQPLFILSMLSSILFISWKLTIFILIIAPITGFILTFIGKSLSRKSQRVLKQNDRFISMITEAFAGIKILKGFRAESFQNKRFSKELNILKKLRFRQSVVHSLNIPIAETMGSLVVVGVLIFGAYIVETDQSISGKDIVTIILGLLLMIEPIKKLGEVYNEFKIGMVSVERVFDILQVDSDEANYGKKEKEHFLKNIRFQINKYKYTPDANFQLEKIHFEIKKGETVALVGASGSGKSTVADLFARFYKPDKNSIFIDDIDITDVSNKSLRNLITFVPQDSFLFNDTVQTNIQFNTENVNQERIEYAARLANAEEFILRLDDGYNTSVGDRGNNLSGGQKQRVSIARALLRNSPIIILDEATSALDSESEQIVQSAIDSLMKEHTSLVIAHRLSTIINADKIIVMDNGKIIEIGTHKELLIKDGYYKKLYSLQYGNESE